jgi:hypothetical protein
MVAAWPSHRQSWAEEFAQLPRSLRSSPVNGPPSEANQHWACRVRVRSLSSRYSYSQKPLSIDEPLHVKAAVLVMSAQSVLADTPADLFENALGARDDHVIERVVLEL